MIAALIVEVVSTPSCVLIRFEMQDIDFVCFNTRVLPLDQAAVPFGASRASVAPLQVTWMSAACGVRACRSAASTGPSTTSK